MWPFAPQSGAEERPEDAKESQQGAVPGRSENHTNVKKVDVKKNIAEKAKKTWRQCDPQLFWIPICEHIKGL